MTKKDILKILYNLRICADKAYQEARPNSNKERSADFARNVADWLYATVNDTELDEGPEIEAPRMLTT